MYCNRRSGWTFHSLEDISSTDTADSSSSHEMNSMSHSFDQSSKNDTSNTKLISDLVDNFHTDGFLTLSSLLTPQFTTRLHNECMDIFNGVLEWLLLKGDVEFSSSFRKQSTSTSIDQQTTEDRSSSTAAVYEYPLSVGLKNGYKELVMRSPGRYEMALLIDELPQHYHNRLCEQQENEVIDRFGETAADYEGKWLMNIKLLDSFKVNQCIDASAVNDTEESSNIKSNGSYCDENEEEKSYLKQLLEWIQHPKSTTSESNDGSRNSIEQIGQQYPIDQANVARFMKLVGKIYPPSSSTTATASDSMADNKVNNNTTTTTNKQTDNNTQQQQDDYYICNLQAVQHNHGMPTEDTPPSPNMNHVMSLMSLYH